MPILDNNYFKIFEFYFYILIFNFQKKINNNANFFYIKSTYFKQNLVRI